MGDKVDVDKLIGARDFPAACRHARELIANNEIKGALKVIKKVLAADPNNYQGLVAYGVAALSSPASRHEAQKAFRKAIAVDPKASEAYLGLADYHESVLKEDRSISDLLEVYAKLLEIDTGSRWQEVLSKAETMEVSTIRLLGALLQNPDKMEKSCRGILSNVAKAASLTDEEVTDGVVPALKNAVRLKMMGLQDATGAALNKLLSLERFEEVADLVNFIGENEPYIPLQLLLPSLASCIVKDIPNIDKIFSSLYTHIFSECDRMKKYNPHAEVIYCSLCVHFNRYTEVRDYLQSVIYKGSPYKGLLSKYLVISLFHLLSFEEALRVVIETPGSPAREVLHLISRVNDEDYLKMSKRILLRSLENEKDPDLLVALCFTYAGLEEHDKLTRLLDLLEERKEATLLRSLTLDISDAIKYIRKLPPSEHLLYLGVLYSKIGSKRALETFNKIIEATPYIHVPIDFQGYYFFSQEKWTEAYLAFQASYDCNPYRWETLDLLTDALLKADHEDSALNLLSSIKYNHLRANYVGEQACFKLAKLFHKAGRRDHINRGNVECLRYCIKRNSSKKVYKVLLAEALASYKSFRAAFHTYRAIFLANPACLIPCALAIHMTKKSSQSLIYYVRSRQLQTLAPDDSLLSVFNVADSAFHRGRKLASKAKFTKASSMYQIGFLFAAKGLSINSSFSCLWKLLGDALFQCTKIDSVECFESFLIPVWLLKGGTFKSGCLSTHLSLFPYLAFKCYFMGLRCCTHDSIKAHFWNDAAVALRTLSKTYKEQHYLQLALSCAVKATQLYSKKWLMWNTLGVIAAEAGQFELASAALGKCVNYGFHPMEITEANLGVLKVLGGNFVESLESFDSSRTKRSSYLPSWLGRVIYSFHTKELMEIPSKDYVIPSLMSNLRKHEDIIREVYNKLGYPKSELMSSYDVNDLETLLIVGQGFMREGLYEKAEETFWRGLCSLNCQMTEDELSTLIFNSTLLSKRATVSTFLGLQNLIGTPCHFSKAFLFAKMGRHHDALKSLQKVPMDQENQAHVLLSMHYMLKRLGREEEAKRVAEYVHRHCKLTSVQKVLLYKAFIEEPTLATEAESKTQLNHVASATLNLCRSQPDYSKVFLSLKILCDCERRFLTLSFWQSYEAKDYTDAFKHFSALIKKGLLDDKNILLIGAHMAAELGDVNFLSRLVRLHPSNLVMWKCLLTSFAKSRSMKHKEARFLNSLKSHIVKCA